MSVYETLLSVIVGAIIGAIIGFFSSIGFDRYKEGREKKELKDRIREELEIIQREIRTDLEKEAFQSRAFFPEGFTALKSDLIRKLDASTFRAILETYIKIDQLKFPSNILDQNKTKYMEAIETIRKTIELLK
jgi:predicted membrane chloride channel (bestrophin family)